jgi:hypothetical protein
VATAETDARLLAFGRAGTAAHVERLARGWRRADRLAEARETARRHASRALHLHQDEDGMVVLRGRLEPEVGALLLQALAAARETLYQRERLAEGDATGSGDVSAETPSLAQRQADALALLAETALHHGVDPGAPAGRYQVVVHVDAPALADPDQPGHSVLEDGTGASAETSRRLACEASRVVMRHDEVNGDAVTALRAHHDTLGLRLHARTAIPGWLGERLDLGWAIDVLHPRARGPTSLDHSGFGR